MRFSFSAMPMQIQLTPTEKKHENFQKRKKNSMI